MNDNEKADPFVRAVRAIVLNDEARFFVEWLVRNKEQAVSDAAASTNADDMLKISGRIYEYEFLLSSIDEALEKAQCGDVELYIGERLYSKARYGRKARAVSAVAKFFKGLFRLGGTGSSEPQHKI